MSTMKFCREWRCRTPTWCTGTWWTHAASEFTQVLYDDVASDPALPRTKSVRCAACGHGEAVFFQARFAIPR
ncbi:hypothetical protein EJB05_25929, partial [Eragrostis curvula]